MPRSQPEATEKSALRSAMRAKRSRLPAEKAHALSLAAQQHLLRDPAWNAARSVGLYYAVRGEVDTATLRDRARSAGKRVYLPYTPPGANGALLFLPCPDDAALVDGVFGIKQPDLATSPLPPEGGWRPDLIVVPGVAYDRRGYRLGAGGGYYDRLFASPSMRDVTRLGLAYAFQIVDALPVEPWDIPMHGLCTEEGLTWL